MKVLVDLEDLRNTLYEKDMITIGGIKIINSYLYKDNQINKPIKTKNSSGYNGHWITEEEAEEMGNYSLRDTCSVCGHCDWDCTESKGFNFCPNCGARMDKGGDGE